MAQLRVNSWLFQIAQTFITLSLIQTKPLFIRVLLALSYLCMVFWAYYHLTLKLGADTFFWSITFLCINTFLCLPYLKPLLFICMTPNQKQLFANYFSKYLSKYNYRKLIKTGELEQITRGSESVRLQEQDERAKTIYYIPLIPQGFRISTSYREGDGPERKDTEIIVWNSGTKNLWFGYPAFLKYLNGKDSKYSIGLHINNEGLGQHMPYYKFPFEKLKRLTKSKELQNGVFSMWLLPAIEGIDYIDSIGMNPSTWGSCPKTTHKNSFMLNQSYYEINSNHSNKGGRSRILSNEGSERSSVSGQSQSPNRRIMEVEQDSELHEEQKEEEDVPQTNRNLLTVPQ